MNWPWRPKEGTDRRKSRRVSVKHLEAVYWDGSANSSHAIREVSYDGAMIDTDVEWIEGTMILLSIRLVRAGGPVQESDLSSQLWCRVVRRTPTGFCVEFLFFTRGARRAFRHYLDAKLGQTAESPKVRNSILEGSGAG